MLKAKKPMGKYKNTNSWLDAIYRNNKELIDKKIIRTTKETSKAIFKQIVREYIDQGLSPSKAVKTLEKSTKFTPKQDRMIKNMYKKLSSSKDEYNLFRSLTRDKKGRFTKVDLSKFSWDSEQQFYIYKDGDKTIVVDLRRSPEEILVYEL